MTLGVIGKKLGMTQVYDENGLVVPVTVVQVEPLTVTQVKTVETDGYNALQITTGTRREKRVTSAQKGHFAKAGVEAGRGSCTSSSRRPTRASRPPRSPCSCRTTGSRPGSFSASRGKSGRAPPRPPAE